MSEFTAHIAMTDKAAERARWAAVLAKPLPTRRVNVSAWRAIVRFFCL